MCVWFSIKKRWIALMDMKLNELLIYILIDFEQEGEYVVMIKKHTKVRLYKWVFISVI